MDTTAAYSEAVAAAVREAMDAAGATRLGVAAATGIPRTTLGRRLLGTSSFTIAEVHAIASHLGIDPVSILTAERVA